MLEAGVFSFKAADRCSGRLLECGSPGTVARRWKSRAILQRRTSILLVFAAANPAVGGSSGFDYSREDSLRQGLRNGSGRGASKIFAKWKFWERKNESALNKEDALPLPMTYPNSEPLPKEEVQKAAECDPETQNCKSVVYQWTGECRRCQGTGVVSFYRKNGKEVIGNCIMCLGIELQDTYTSTPAEMSNRTILIFPDMTNRTERARKEEPG